jgi:hypothetical protein
MKKKSKGAQKMKGTSLKKICLPCLFSVAIISLALNFPVTCYGLEIDIDVCPNIVNIESKGEEHPVRVFTNISFSTVANSSVLINGEEIPSWKTRDSWGNLIVKFYLDELDPLMDEELLNLDGKNVLTVYGVTRDDVSFSGEGIIFIIDKKGF